MDSSFARTFSLLATYQEFVDAKQASENIHDPLTKPIFASACPGNEGFFSKLFKCNYYFVKNILLLFLGWICYAEKTHGELLVPYLSKVRSPQAISGALIKNYLAKLKGLFLSETNFFL